MRRGVKLVHIQACIKNLNFWLAVRGLQACRHQVKELTNRLTAMQVSFDSAVCKISFYLIVILLCLPGVLQASRSIRQKFWEAKLAEQAYTQAIGQIWTCQLLQFMELWSNNRLCSCWICPRRQLAFFLGINGKTCSESDVTLIYISLNRHCNRQKNVDIWKLCFC